MPEHVYTYVSLIIFRTLDKSDRDDNLQVHGWTQKLNRGVGLNGLQDTSKFS